MKLVEDTLLIPITLPPGVRSIDLEEFLDEHYPYHYMVHSRSDDEVVFVVPEEGQQALKTLISAYWHIDTHNPRKFFTRS